MPSDGNERQAAVSQCHSTRLGASQESRKPDAIGVCVDIVIIYVANHLDNSLGENGPLSKMVIQGALYSNSMIQSLNNKQEIPALPNRQSFLYRYIHVYIYIECFGNSSSCLSLVCLQDESNSSLEHCRGNIS